MTAAELINKARKVLEQNLKAGVNFFYISPAGRKYPHQWLWDSCFHAIVNSKLNPDWAKMEMKTLLSAVDEKGFLPSIIRWQGTQLIDIVAWLLFQGKTSRLTQPPVVAIAVEEIFKETGDVGFVTEVLPALDRYYRWLGTERDPDGDHLISIIHPWEGTDDSPAFDKALLGKKEGRPNAPTVYFSFYKLLVGYWLMGWDLKKILASYQFNVENVMFNCIYAQSLRSLKKLYLAINNLEAAQDYEQRANLVEEAILKHCYNRDRGLFFDVIHRGERYEHNTTVTLSSLFPIILDKVPRQIQEELVSHLTNPHEFWLPYPVPFVSKKETAFNPSDNLLLWRGPVWINTNWFVWRGLVKHGYKELASQLAKKTIGLVARSGFREFYNPFNGRGEGQNNYSWSTLIVDMLEK